MYIKFGIKFIFSIKIKVGIHKIEKKTIIPWCGVFVLLYTYIRLKTPQTNYTRLSLAVQPNLYNKVYL